MVTPEQVQATSRTGCSAARCASWATRAFRALVVSEAFRGKSACSAISSSTRRSRAHAGGDSRLSMRTLTRRSGGWISSSSREAFPSR